MNGGPRWIDPRVTRANVTAAGATGRSAQEQAGRVQVGAGRRAAETSRGGAPETLHVPQDPVVTDAGLRRAAGARIATTRPDGRRTAAATRAAVRVVPRKRMHRMSLRT